MNAFEFRRLNETIRTDFSYPRRLPEHHLENDKRLFLTSPIFKLPSCSLFDTLLIKSLIVLLMNVISTLHSLLSNVIESTPPLHLLLLLVGVKTLSVTAAVNDCSYSGRQRFQRFWCLSECLSEGHLSVLFRRICSENKHFRLKTDTWLTAFQYYAFNSPSLSPTKFVFAKVFESIFCFMCEIRRFVHSWRPQDVTYHVSFAIGNPTLYSNAVST